MMQALIDRRKWTSEKVIQYVDIVFGFVVGQLIVRNIKLIQNPTSNPFQFTALCVVIITVSLSWLGYHRSMFKYPYMLEKLTLKNIRPFTDLIIVVLYTVLLFKIDDFDNDPSTINLTSFIFIYLEIFFFYIIDGSLRVNEYKDDGASKRALSVKFVVFFFFLWIIYASAHMRNYIPREILNYTALFCCLLLIIRYRTEREPHYSDTSLTLVVDVDGVLGYQVTPILEKLNLTRGTCYNKIDIRRWDQPLPLANTDIKSEIENSYADSEYILNMKPIDGCQQALRELSQYCEISIATNRNPEADENTKEWLKKNKIHFDNYINTSKLGKGAVKGHILIDDYPKNIIEFLKQPINTSIRKAFLFSQPWNENDDSLRPFENIERVTSWREILCKIKSL